MNNAYKGQCCARQIGAASFWAAQQRFEYFEQNSWLSRRVVVIKMSSSLCWSNTKRRVLMHFLSPDQSKWT